jgi:hypothetical protein
MINSDNKETKSIFYTYVKETKEFDWEKIIENCNSLEDFNDSQWRFLKALIIELSVEKYSNNKLKYVGEKHKDFDWPDLKISVELKSNTSCTMYTKKGHLRKKYSILQINSMCTNNKQTLDVSDISDIIIAVYSDGVFVVDKETALQHIYAKGDGFSLVLPKDKVTIIGKFSSNKKNKALLSLKQDIIDLIRNKI